MRWKNGGSRRKFGVKEKFAWLPILCKGFGGIRVWVWLEKIYVRMWVRCGSYTISYYTPERMLENKVREEEVEGVIK